MVGPFYFWPVNRIYAALAEAGGEAAQRYLVSVAKKTSVDKALEELYALIGRASRT